jgi:hypothetical protein
MPEGIGGFTMKEMSNHTKSLLRRLAEQAAVLDALAGSPPRSNKKAYTRAYEIAKKGSTLAIQGRQLTERTRERSRYLAWAYDATKNMLGLSQYGAALVALIGTPSGARLPEVPIERVPAAVEAPAPTVAERESTPVLPEPKPKRIKSSDGNDEFWSSLNRNRNPVPLVTDDFDPDTDFRIRLLTRDVSDLKTIRNLAEYIFLDGDEVRETLESGEHEAIVALHGKLIEGWKLAHAGRKCTSTVAAVQIGYEFGSRGAS